MPQMRTALVDAQILPRDLTPAGYKSWAGSEASSEAKLRDFAGLRRCLFNASAADAPRREQLRAIFAQVEGADWASKDEWSGIAAELSNDPDTILAYYLPKD